MTTEVTAKFYGTKFVYWVSVETDLLEEVMDRTGVDTEWNATVVRRIQKLRAEMLDTFGVPSVNQSL